MFGRGKKASGCGYDSAKQLPVLRCSICTGEKVAGFKDLESGKFQDMMLIRDDRDLQRFCSLYGIDGPDKISKEY